MVAELLRRLRRVPDRMLHASRRRAALALLGARPKPTSILVLCNGNIFRSPFAAAVLRRALASSGIRVDSAGLMAPGRPSPPDAVAAAAKRGFDLTTHRSQPVTTELVRAADLIVVMDSVQSRVVRERFGRVPRDIVFLGDLDPEPAARRPIEDPVEQGEEVCGRVYARIERCVTELTRALGRLRSARVT